MSLGSLKEDLILDILGLAHLYGFQELETSISEYLKAVLSVRTVCLIYDTASLYQVIIYIKWWRRCLSSCLITYASSWPLFPQQHLFSWTAMLLR